MLYWYERGSWCFEQMRLAEESRKVIRDTAREIFGPAEEARLFGSRLDDTARGGDLDFLVILPESLVESPRKSLTFVARLQRRLGDQHIDVLVLARSPRASRCTSTPCVME